MDALMAALVLGAITQAGDRTGWLAAILADRWRAPALVVAAAAVALAVNYAIGVAAGLAVAPLLTPEARLLLLALALLLAGLGTGWRHRRPDDLAGWRIGRAATALLGLFVMVLGDRMQFVAAALGARSLLPWAAAVGATIGALAVVAAAVALGEAGWQRLPHRAIRLASAAVLTIAGVVTGLSALSLI
ncbi:TMEM165/GDT1 family protein [uncultured Sphingomonas sp.]|uniref:TMEM165/GDT1 family protein n=1 Tax=uncultured Sphingomonas sp. TaxID=158754 RepID=UPI002585CF38|nr:TMEM165/GDT1 family protein [uncultured Sphingomonas sp.]